MKHYIFKFLRSLNLRYRAVRKFVACRKVAYIFQLKCMVIRHLSDYRCLVLPSILHCVPKGPKIAEILNTLSTKGTHTAGCSEAAKGELNLWSRRAEFTRWQGSPDRGCKHQLTGEPGEGLTGPEVLPTSFSRCCCHLAACNSFGQLTKPDQRARGREGGTCWLTAES